MKHINFIFFKKYFEMGDCMSDMQFGRAIKAIGAYLRYGDESLAENLEGYEKILYAVMKPEIEQGHKKYTARCNYNKNKKNNNINNKNNIYCVNNNKNNMSSANYDFDEIERLELERRNNEIGADKDENFDKSIENMGEI